MARNRDGKGVTIIRKIEETEAPHHGGAWKVAYADFVTAMMAFFLLMWLLNSTTEEQRQGLADYFTPMNAFSHGVSGNGQPFGGRTPNSTADMVSDRGSMTTDPGRAPEQPDPDQDEAELSRRDRPQHPADAPAAAGENGAGEARAEQPANAAPHQYSAADLAALKAEMARHERAAFEQAAEQIRTAVSSDPALADVARQLAIDQTPEGLRIQLLDQDNQPMFATGSAAIEDRARLLLQKIAPVLARLPERLSISGHTDAAPFRGGDRTNWELSSERANATRRLLSESGLDESRFRSVTGNADRDPLLPNDPLAAANRRIAILVLPDSGR
jgi:chemotaxis protein MotB